MTAPLLRVADLPRRALMGVVNVTPDSFSDGGRFLDPAAAIAHGRELKAAGAAILDVGGESTRPGADPVSAEEEIRRVTPVILGLVAEGDVPVSIDTAKADVAAAALDAGARMVNDITGGRDPDMLPLVARRGAAYVAMHMRGTPRTMQEVAEYDDVVGDVARELLARVDATLAAGVAPEGLLADPGIGFAKTGEHNVALLRALPELARALGVPLVVGASRKSFLARIAGEDGRDDATLATTVWSFELGAAVVRVHDVVASQHAVALLDVLDRATPEGMAA